MTSHPSDNLPDDLRSIERTLDALGAAERDGAPGGLEHRIALATTARVGDAQPPVLARIGFAGWKRLAATIAIVASAGLIIVATTQRVGSVAQDGEVADAAAIEAELDAWLIEPDYYADDAFASLRSDLDEFDASLGDGAIDEADPLLDADLESMS
jgi:hypothetical protein